MKAIYAGSFDPVTYGHLDIIRRASRVFDLTVAVGTNPSKKYTLDLQTRIRLIEKHCPNLRVVEFGGLLADFTYEQGISTIIKGARNHQDFDYERLLHDISVTQQVGIDTHILVSRPEMAHISSGAAKELVRHAGLVHDYIPLNAKQALELANDQIIVGVTGEIAAGKSYVGGNLASMTGVPANHIDLDHLVHFMYKSDAPVHIELRNKIRAEFDLKEFSRKELGELVFNDYVKLTRLNELIRNPLLTLLRNAIRNKKGVIFINSALLVETNLLSLCNNNVIVVQASLEDRKARLKQRGFNDEQIARRINAQYSTIRKIWEIQKAIDRHSHGRYIVHEDLNKTQEWVSNL